MCNVEEKCKAMRNSALRVLTKHLKEAREVEHVNNCQKITEEIDKELSAYECEASNMLKERIKSYQQSEYRNEKLRIIDMIIDELEAFMA